MSPARAGRQVDPGRRIVAAGVIDSLGLSLGWTVFVLIAVSRDGLVVAGLYNAAMFVGVMASAPVAGLLSHRLTGRRFLVASGAVELVLRVGSLAALVVGAPTYAVAALVALMNIATWSGYAGMRAEIAVVNPLGRTMTHYAVAVTAVEALGTMLAALLPVLPGGRLDLTMVVVVGVVYGASLAPQFWCARLSRVPRGRDIAHRPPRERLRVVRARRDRAAGRRRMYAAGGVLMVIASGPVTLSTPLADELGGHLAVVLSAAAVGIGALAAPALAAQVHRLGLPARVRWPLWGAAMLVGWTVAPTGLAGLLFAQASSAAALTAWQGDMDTAVAAAAPGRPTAALAWSTSVRAGGTAIATRMLPLVATAQQVGLLSAAACAVLLVAAGGLLAGRARALSAPARAEVPVAAWSTGEQPGTRLAADGAMTDAA